jgi:hypothetical protein
MPRFPRFPLYVVAAAGLAAAACSKNAFEPMAVTRDASTVAGCEKIADLKAVPGTFDNSDAQAQLEREAREKGANTVLISDAEGRTGVAYRCAMPSVASPGGTR